MKQTDKPYIKIRSSEYTRLCRRLTMEQLMALPFYFCPEPDSAQMEEN